MLFDNVQRWSYAVPQVKEVICQLRFPTILTINEKSPADFQEAIRDAFPRYECRKQAPAPRLVGVGTPNAKLEQGDPVTHHIFLSSTGLWKIILTQDSFAISTTRYNAWEDLAQRLDRPLAEFIRIYHPAYFQRIGLRYLNMFSRKELRLEDTPWRELFHPAYLGVLNDPALDEKCVGKASTETQLTFPDQSHLTLRTGPGRLKLGNQMEADVRFIVDIDCSVSGQLSGSIVPEKLSLLHGHASAIFRGAITETLHNAMGPTLPL